MPKRSAGLLMYRQREEGIQVFLVHPGGPFWSSKDLGAWTIPKGEYSDEEQPLPAAQREFKEETGFTAEGNFVELGSVRQASGKIVSAWAFAGDCDPEHLVSNFCSIEWPPRSGRSLEIPEADRGGWFTLAQARDRILKTQVPLLDALARKLADSEL